MQTQGNTFKMAIQNNSLFRLPVLAACAVLFLVWSLWLLDLHPHYREHAPALIAQAFGPGIDCSSQCPTSSGNSLKSTPDQRISHTPDNPTKPKDRPLVLYAFVDQELPRKNLKFFIKHALHDAADFLFILNGDTDAENLLPKKSNIRYVKRKNDCFDMGAYAEVLVKDDLYKNYTRYITMNSSIRGPFLPTWSKSCWSDEYLGKLNDKVKLVGMTMGCRPHPHVQSMIWGTDRAAMEALLFPSAALVEKFAASLPPHDKSHQVPPWETAGINTCPHEYWKAVAIEVFATPLIRAAGYEVDVMMTAYHSMPKYEETCMNWQDGDILSNGKYYGMSIHPFDTIFAKTNRGNDPVVLERLTEWQDLREYSSYDYCH